VVVNPGGVVTNAVNTVQQVVTHTGGTTGSTGGGPSIGACHAHWHLPARPAAPGPARPARGDARPAAL
jgi:hypothetical protein